VAFWKKSDDPWDRKPEKRKETVWYEQDIPEAEPVGADTIRPGEEKEESLGESIRKFWLGVGVDEEPIPPEICPWCGKEMEWGRLTGGRDSVIWQNWQPKGVLDFKKPENWKSLNMLDEEKGLSSFKTVWLCSDCGKMVLDAPKSGYSASQPKVDVEAYTGGGGFAANPKAYEEYKSQWERKEGE